MYIVVPRQYPLRSDQLIQADYLSQTLSIPPSPLPPLSVNIRSAPISSVPDYPRQFPPPLLLEERHVNGSSHVVGDLVATSLQTSALYVYLCTFVK